MGGLPSDTKNLRQIENINVITARRGATYEILKIGINSFNICGDQIACNGAEFGEIDPGSHDLRLRFHILRAERGFCNLNPRSCDLWVTPPQVEYEQATSNSQVKKTILSKL